MEERAHRLVACGRLRGGFDLEKGETGMRIIRAVSVGAAILALSGFGLRAAAQEASAKDAKPAMVGAAAQYCKSTGGRVEMRQAVYGTNNPPNQWLHLAAEQPFCQYTQQSDGSRIHLSLLTLYTTKPTLAALAYYSEVPWNGQGNGNPASYYCTQLGGAEIGATDFNGGGWVSAGGIDQVLEACIFPDNSTIDSWGLFYHSNNIIRGIDLSTVLRYPNPYPEKK
jgi:putative hemolysin